MAEPVDEEKESVARRLSYESGLLSREDFYVQEAEAAGRDPDFTLVRDALRAERLVMVNNSKAEATFTAQRFFDPNPQRSNYEQAQSFSARARACLTPEQQVAADSLQSEFED